MRAYAFSLADQFNNRRYESRSNRELRNNCSPETCGSTESACENLAYKFHFGSNPITSDCGTDLDIRPRIIPALPERGNLARPQCRTAAGESGASDEAIGLAISCRERPRYASTPRTQSQAFGFSRFSSSNHQHRIVNTGQCAWAITWCAVDHGRCVVPTSAEERAPSTIMSDSRSEATLRMQSAATPNSCTVSGRYCRAAFLGIRSFSRRTPSSMGLGRLPSWV